MRSEALRLDRLQALLPGLAVAEEAVGAEPLQLVARPRNAEEVSQLMRAASSGGWRVVVRGAGTKPGWGGRGDSRPDLILETLAMNQLVEHEPGDLICVAGAGMRLEELQRVVGSAEGYRQRLMLDPPQGGASTLGGLVATRAHGPLRTRYGAMRELLLGARLVLADGTIARTGGKVVKNVAGYDLDKLLVGSGGELAVVVEVSLRLHPQAESSRSVLIEGLGPADTAAFCLALRRTAAVPSVVEALWPERKLLVRVDSSEEGATRQSERIAELSPAARLLDESQAAEWEAVIAARPWAGPGLIVALAVPLSEITRLLEVADAMIAAHDAVELSLRPTLGTAELRLAPGSDRLVWLSQQLSSLGGHLEFHRAVQGESLAIDSITNPGTARLMGAVKRALDPAFVLPFAMAQDASR